MAILGVLAGFTAATQAFGFLGGIADRAMAEYPSPYQTSQPGTIAQAVGAIAILFTPNILGEDIHSGAKLAALCLLLGTAGRYAEDRGVPFSDLIDPLAPPTRARMLALDPPSALAPRSANFDTWGAMQAQRRNKLQQPR